MKLKVTITIIISIFMLGCSTTPLSKTDKLLFTGLVASQVHDFATTENNLNKSNNSIKSEWAWKYRTDKPTDFELALVKGVELLAAYYIAKNLEDPYRKIFLVGASLLLLNYSFSNLK